MNAAIVYLSRRIAALGGGVLSFVFAVALLATAGCRSQPSAGEENGISEHPPADASTGPQSAVAPSPFAAGPFVIESVGVDAGAEGGPNCTGAGDPIVTTADGGASCTGALAQAIFTYGLCSCTTISASGTLTTDGFDSTKGGPDGGAGGSVGADNGLSWSNTTSIGGNLWTPGNVTASAKGTLRGDLHLGGTLSASAPVTVNGNAFVTKTLPSNAKVLGTVTKVSSVAAPCDCANILPIASITAAHKSPNNDDGTIGLLATAGTGSSAARIDLPCGNYYLSQINVSAPLTIAVHGHTALYVDGNVNASAALAFQVDPTATLDLFVAGTFSASGTLTLGPQNSPAHCRAFIAGSAVSLSASATIGCNVYAPNAQISLSGNATTSYGALFGKGIAESGNATVHYDTSVLNAGGECCSASKCDDGNPCTVDTCNGDGTCSHTPATNGTTCAGTNKCEQTYTCQAGVCMGSNPVTCTASDACHVAGTCNTATGACSNPVAADGTTCTGTNKCNQKYACVAGACTGSSPVTCTAGDQCHTAGTCDPTSGACSNPAVANGTTCNDGNACTTVDTCQAGACTGASPVTCTASDQCHVAGACNPATGVCSNPTASNGTSCSDGNACTRTDTCQSGVCAGSNPVTCTASDQCHAAGTCNPSTGACSNPVAANGTTCSDGNACTKTDTCQAGVCAGGNPVTCTASDQCHAAGTCDPTSGACSNPAITNGTACNDGNACTTVDKCQAGACTGTSPVTCTASDQCHAAGTCTPSTGVCSNPAVANGTSCTDGNACTKTDTCQAGVCAGANPVTCAASDQCRAAGTCDVNTGTCSNPAATNGTSCNDGNACTQTDTCQAGACAGTNPVTCTASDQCHAAGSCNPSTGTCSNPALSDGSSCNDGNACTQGDACQSGTCVGPTPVSCNSPGPCQTGGTCNPQTGCVYGQVADGTACSGTDLCNHTYQCSAGACMGSNPVVCTASDACHIAGSCDPTSGSCSNPAAADGTSCNDGDACTQSDSCRSGTCTGSNPIICATLDGCHAAGSCNPSTGTCSNPRAPDGTSCGTSDGGVSLVCMAGACAPQTPCTASQTLCKGLCVGMQSDAANCGACGNACAPGYSCVAGSCFSPAILHSCIQSGNSSVLVAGDVLTIYVPSGPGVEKVVLHGETIVSFENISLPRTPIGCATSWVTGETVCISGGTDVYLIQGSTLTATLTDGATAVNVTSNGGAPTTGVTIDATANTATLTLGASVSGVSQGAYQVLDLTTHTFGPIIPAGTAPPPSQSRNPNLPEGAGLFASENSGFDPFRQLVLSPSGTGDFQIVKMSAAPAVYDNFQLPSGDNNGNQHFDAVAEDCTTGIAVASDESATPKITLVDLTQAVFTPGVPNGTWSAPSSELLFDIGALDFTGITVAPGSHLGMMTPAEGLGDNTTPLIAFQLPSSAGSGTPALADWALVRNLKDPSGSRYFFAGGDPHPLISYVSPAGRAMGIFPGTTISQISPYLFALIDLQGLLDAPRLPGTHTVDPSYDLIAHGFARFVAPCSQFNIHSDPANCGGCGNVCLTGPNAIASCVAGRCGLTCAPGFADCNSNPSDGCEANFGTDGSNCGVCGTSCSVPNSTGVCSSGSCKLTCGPGFSDCDGMESNGCETAGSCAPPVVSASGPTNVTVGDTPTYVATATDPAVGRTMSFAWTALSAPAPVTFGSPAALTTTAQFSAPGTYVLQFEATDGFGTGAATLTVAVVLVNHPPVVTVGPDQTLAAPTLSTTLAGGATDDGLPVGATLSSTWSLISGPVAVSIATPTQSVPEPGPLTATTNVTFSYPGTYVFAFAVSDTKLTATASTTVTVNAPAAATAATPPTVAIGGVTDDALVTKPTPILGTVSDGAWVLEKRLGGRDDVQTPWDVMASGAGTVNATPIAKFDPTLLLNGIYTLRLSATNSAGSASTSVSLSVDGRMKVGDFTLTFTDLDTAVGGLPLTITRTYDSRDKTVGDFGVGWNLGIRDVRVEKSGKTGAYWTQQFTNQGVFGQFCLIPTRAATVTVTFPGGRQYRFQAKSSPECQLMAPLLTPDIIWESTSDPDNPTIQLVALGGSSVFANDVGNGVTQLQDTNFNIWDPRQFTLTTEDGSVWQIDQDLGVTSLLDRNGNILTITPQGIHHSSGKQVNFVRDAKGRITTITDPAGNAMTYGYDKNGDLALYTDRASNVTQFSYAGNHYLQDIQDPLGRQAIRNEYDATGRLLSSTDALGNKVAYTHNLAANQDQVADRLGHVTLYTYNDRGDITQKTDATGAVWHYTFDIRGNKLTDIDPLGHTKTTTYDGANNPLSMTDALGNVTRNTYNFFQQLVTTTDPLGHVATNGYDGSGNLVTTTDAIGNLSRYTYDDKGNRLTEVDPLNGVTQSLYDAAGHVVQRVDAVGQARTYQYDANGKKTQEQYTDTSFSGSSGIVTTHYTYDADGRLLNTAIDSGPTRSTTYTATGKRATATDEDGRVTTYAYDALDRLTTTTHPDGTTTSQSYDAEGRALSSTDEAGNTTAYVYDPLGRRVRTTFADGASTSSAYDSAGNAIQSADELGHVTWSAYDATGRLTSTTDATGAKTQSVYDAAGNTASRTDALGHTTSYAYDADNRVVATTYADGSAESTTYDAAGRMSARTDTLARSTHYAYDHLGQLVQVTDVLGNITQYAYNEKGALNAQADANNNVTTFLYDFVTGVETARFLPDGSAQRHSVDNVGQLLRRTDFKGQRTFYTYDLRGRVLTRAYPDGSVVSFTYTPTGRRATATDARGTTSYAYDSRNRVVKITYPDGRVLSMGYDAHSNRTSLTAKIGATTLGTTTGYDAANRPARITDPLARSFGITYDADGNRTQITYPNGTATTYAYDALNRLTNLTATETPASGPPTTVTSFAYTLDEGGRRTQLTESDGTVRQYAYDGIDRLTGETVTGALNYAKTFTYDPVGNRRTQTTTGSGAAVINYAYDVRDELTTENATTYGYDANGDVTLKSGEATYSWDFENRLTNVAMAGGTTVAHQYDTDGNRVQTTVTPTAGPATTTNMLVDTVGCVSCGGGLSQVIADTDANGSITALYIRAGDELLEVMRPGATSGTWTTKFVHHDGLGSVRALTDEMGTTGDTRAYEAFGTKNVEAGSDPLVYGFAGEPFQADSMLAYHRARWMDARVGRFEGMDSKDGSDSQPLTLHRYLYAWNFPTAVVDPSGNDGVDAEASFSFVVSQFLFLNGALLTVNGQFTDAPDILRATDRTTTLPYAVTTPKVDFFSAGKLSWFNVSITLSTITTKYVNGATLWTQYAGPAFGCPSSSGPPCDLGEHESLHRQFQKDWWTFSNVWRELVASGASFQPGNRPAQLQAISKYLFALAAYEDAQQNDPPGEPRPAVASTPPIFGGER